MSWCLSAREEAKLEHCNWVALDRIINEQCDIQKPLDDIEPYLVSCLYKILVNSASMLWYLNEIMWKYSTNAFYNMHVWLLDTTSTLIFSIIIWCNEEQCIISVWIKLVTYFEEENIILCTNCSILISANKHQNCTITSEPVNPWQLQSHTHIHTHTTSFVFVF